MSIKQFLTEKIHWLLFILIQFEKKLEQDAWSFVFELWFSREITIYMQKGQRDKVGMQQSTS